MKVLMTCDAIGGVWQYANDLAGALGDEGVDVLLAVLGPQSSGQPVAGVRAVETNLPLDWLATGPEEVLGVGRAIAALAAEHAVDLVHLNAPALAAAGPFSAPVAAVAHGCVGTWFAAAEGSAPPLDLVWHGELMRAGLLAADAVVAPSASYAATLQQHYQLPTTPLIVHNGRASASVEGVSQADHVLTVGRLWDRAKSTALLDAVAGRLSVPFRAAGPLTAPQGEAVALKHLQWLGVLEADALAAEYATAPIFVSAARFEPFGLAVLEAAQAGCPLVLSGIDTFRELWTGAALFVAGDEPEAWVAAIERVRTEPGLREHLGEAARARAARYTVSAMAAGTLALYRELLAAPMRAAA